MQVTRLEDFDTHAVIGGGVVRAFEMAQTAEFFTALSDTLYRDKKRALVREVLCNAWDAHITSDQTARPVEITISETELVIRDFGPGIADDRIADIYCTYGKSTKLADDSQTGGFGLGSKAPFAYTDHFTVTSAHRGTRTVYAVSRGGIETGGRPGIRTMVSVPTDQSGLTVTIPIANPADQREFETILKEVVFKGGINALLNGGAMARRDYSGILQHGFALEAPSRTECTSRSFIEVLYGAVTYPATTTDPEITELERKLRDLIGNYSLILAARPGTLSVTPSREALSYTATTTETIRRLLTRAYNMIVAELPPAAKRIAAEVVADYASEGTDRTTPKALTGLETRPREIAYHLLRCHPSRIPNSVTERYCARALMAHMPEARRVLRRVAGGKRDAIATLTSPMSGFGGGYTPVLDSAVNRFAWRRIRRFAMELGVLKAVGYIACDNGWTDSSVINLAKGEPDRPAKAIIIAPSRQAARFHIGRMTHKAVWETFGRGAVPVFSIPEKNGEIRRKIAEAAKVCDLEVVEAYAAKPEPKPAPAAKNYDTLGYNMHVKGAACVVSDPKTFIVKKMGRHSPFVLNGDDLCFLAQEHPTAAIVFAAQSGALERAGARNVFDLLEEEFLKIHKKRTTAYAFAIEKHFFIACNYGVALKAAQMAKLDPRYANHFFPDRAARDPECARTRKIVRAVRALAGLHRVHDECVNALIAVEATARRLFAPFKTAADEDLFAEKHACLSVIDFVRICDDAGASRAFPDAVIAMLRAGARPYANAMRKLGKDEK